MSIGVLPGYDDYPLSDRVAPRRHSRLISPDELRLTSLTYGSPLALILHGVPYVVGGLATYLGATATGALKDGGDGIANLLNLRANIRTQRAKFKADEVEERSRRARGEYELKAQRNTKRGAGHAFVPELPQPGDYDDLVARDDAIEREQYHVETASYLVWHEVTRVVRVAGPLSTILTPTIWWCSGRSSSCPSTRKG